MPIDFLTGTVAQAIKSVGDVPTPGHRGLTYSTLGQ